MNTYKLEENTLMERIRFHYLENYEISPADERILHRWETAHALLLDHHETNRNVVKTLMKRFGISSKCAYEDIHNSNILFGNTRLSNKDAYRYLITQWATDMYRKANKINDFRAMNKALERITKVLNLDKEDPDIPDPTKIQPPVQLLSVNFTFIDSPRFKLIDEKAQKAMLFLYDEFMEQAKLSQLADYLDVFTLKTYPKKKGVKKVVKASRSKEKSSNNIEKN